MAGDLIGNHLITALWEIQARKKREWWPFLEMSSSQ